MKHFTTSGTVRIPRPAAQLSDRSLATHRRRVHGTDFPEAVEVAKLVAQAAAIADHREAGQVLAAAGEILNAWEPTTLGELGVKGVLVKRLLEGTSRFDGKLAAKGIAELTENMTALGIEEVG